MKKILATMTVITFLLAACGPVTAVPINTPTATIPLATEALPQPTTASPAGPVLLGTPESGGGMPAPALAARDDLAARLKIPAEQVQISSILPRDWPDACLGISAPSAMCAAVITAGYEVELVAGTAKYIYHTNMDGKAIRLFSGPGLVQGNEQSNILLEWTGADCSVFSLSNKVAFWGKCGETPQVVKGVDPSQEPVKHWLETFAPFEQDTPSGKVKFIGLGKRVGRPAAAIATAAEQRAMAEWAKLQFEVAQAGRAGAAWGMAFGYHREGGIAGFCDDVAVYLSGEARISNCKGLNTTLYLSASELDQLYAWIDELATVDYSHSDPATADAMKIVLTMPGQGKKTANEATIQAIVEFAGWLVARAGFAAQAKPDVANAEQALVDYFNALNIGDFIPAAKLYGGTTELLQTWNPDVKDNLPLWLERGCKQNGLVCMLPRSIQYRGADARGGYQFLVEFNNQDGSLFAQGPCCGDNSGAPPITSFMFTVIPNDGNWQVMDLPPYVP